MAKVEVTEQLAGLIRSLRIKNNVLSKDLAKEIGKSAAYISKLERAEIHMLDKQLLINILKYVVQDDSSFDNLVQEVFSTLKFQYTQKEIDEQLWFENFDTVERMIPIPEELINELQILMENNNISSSYLLSRINANEALDANVCANESYPYNEWFQTDGSNPNARFIKISISEQLFNGIMNRAITKTAYIYIFAIVFYLLKIERYDQCVNIDEKQNSELMKEAETFLNRFRFYSLATKERLLSTTKRPEEVDQILSSFESHNREVIGDIVSAYKFWSDRDVKAANEQFKYYIDNLQWDLAFMMKLISLEFNTLSRLSYSNKRQLLIDINELIGKYYDLPEEANRYENY